MKENALYILGSGEIVCSKCAGVSVKTTGIDIDGSKAIEASKEDMDYFLNITGKAMTCGCEK